MQNRCKVMDIMSVQHIVTAGVFYQSVEFYVVCVVVAAAVIAAAVRPGERGAVVNHLLAGNIEEDQIESFPRIEVNVRSDGAIELIRYGVQLTGLNGAVSGSVTVNGSDVTFEERIVHGKGVGILSVKAIFVIDFLRPGRYHFRYESDSTSAMAVMTLALSPGVKIVRDLVQ